MALFKENSPSENNVPQTRLSSQNLLFSQNLKNFIKWMVFLLNLGGGLVGTLFQKGTLWVSSAQFIFVLP